MFRAPFDRVKGQKGQRIQEEVGESKGGYLTKSRIKKSLHTMYLWYICLSVSTHVNNKTFISLMNKDWRLLDDSFPEIIIYEDLVTGRIISSQDIYVIFFLCVRIPFSRKIVNRINFKCYTSLCCATAQPTTLLSEISTRSPAKYRSS